MRIFLCFVFWMLGVWVLGIEHVDTLDTGFTGSETGFEIASSYFSGFILTLVGI